MAEVSYLQATMIMNMVYLIILIPILIGVVVIPLVMIIMNGIDQEHPIMEGLGNPVDIYSFKLVI